MPPDETDLNAQQSLLPLNRYGPRPLLSASPGSTHLPTALQYSCCLSSPPLSWTNSRIQQKCSPAKKCRTLWWITESNGLTQSETRDEAEEQEGDLVLQLWKQEGKRKKHREKGSMEELDHYFRMHQRILSTSSSCMLEVACASPRTALPSTQLQKPSSHTLSVLGPLNPEKGASCFLHVREWDSVVQGQSKTSMSHGRGQHGETWMQDNGCFQSAQHSGMWGQRSWPRDSCSSLPVLMPFLTLQSVSWEDC